MAVPVILMSFPSNFPFDGCPGLSHRVGQRGQFRYTTVELLVDKAPIRPRVETVVGVRIEAHERSLQQVVKAAGAKCDHAARLWHMPKRLAGIVRLANRIVAK